MEHLPRISSSGRCSCGPTVWYARAIAVGQRGYFVCRRAGCGRRYLPRQDQWEPISNVLKSIFLHIEEQIDERQEDERRTQNGEFR
jgi:hypothetical protein